MESERAAEASSSRAGLVAGVLALAAILGLGAWQLGVFASRSELERVQARGRLHVLTMWGPTMYYNDGRGDNGFEYLLASAFADSLGVELVVEVRPELSELLQAVSASRADFAAANLTVTAARSRTLAFSSPYLEVTQQLLYRRGSPRPRSLGQLDGELVVMAGSAHGEQLRALRDGLPGLAWRETADLDMSDLVRLVHEGEIAYTVVDSLAYLANRHLYPQARRAFDISEPQSLAWAFPRDGDGSLRAAANRFIESYRESGALQRLRDRLLAHAEDFSAPDAHRLGKLVESRLPALEPLIREVAAEHTIDWHLLAAIAYQESHWDPAARSPTGVRGLMMMTRQTAKEMQVSNRLDPRQSLRGGTAYLMKLKARLPARITEPDRTWLTLAAYNVGFGHLEDARVLTERGGGDPDLWREVRERLPLLAQKKFYRTLAHGFARGGEPVGYVDNIRYYTNYLRLLSIARRRAEQREASGAEQASIGAAAAPAAPAPRN